MKEFSFAILSIILLAGCLSQAEQTEKDCGSDKECLKNAFIKCENAHGTWKGSNGDIKVHIVGKQDSRCGVFVSIPGIALNISGKNMTCYLPMREDNSTFEIKNDCTDELAAFFNK